MNKVLVTGATSFLGYHVVRRLNEQGVRPRVLELRESNLDPLAQLDVDRSEGYLEDPQALESACADIDTVLHLAFKVSVGGGTEIVEGMRQVNVVGTQRLLDAAAAKGVTRVVVTSSALAVGVNRRPEPLDETANWAEHAFDMPYAVSRRHAEQEALAKAKPGFAVVVVCPAFTLGPQDPVGAPANKLLKSLINGKLPFTLPVGFGCLDVRDFANGMVLAAQHGHSGKRYLLSGHNVTTNQLLEQAAAIAGVRAPRFSPPKALVEIIAATVEKISKLRGKPAPITRSVVQIIGRYAWYDTTRARSELGFQPRPFRQTLEDTIRWLREEGSESNPRSGTPVS
ncbi:MAG: NAD-dependent epimerase/dehydratase family protein [Egibacteraceae bacterium]